MNFEYLLRIIREINIIIHAIAGLTCVLVFFFNLFSKKGSKHHIKAGKIFGIGTVFLLGTSLLSFLILKGFPFFLMAYMAYYLFYSSILKSIKNRYSFGFHYLLAIFTALFYLTGGRILGYSDHGFAYLHCGIAFSFFIIWDFYRLFIQKEISRKQFIWMHSNRLIVSFFFILTAFMVSQFSHNEPKAIYILCFIIPVVSTSSMLVINNLVLALKKTTIKKIFFSVIILLLGFTTIELAVRVVTVKPITFFFYNDTDNSSSYSSLILDEDGIYKHHPAFIDSIENSKKDILQNNDFNYKDQVTLYFLLSYLAQTNDLEKIKEILPFYLKGTIENDIIKDVNSNGYQTYAEDLPKEFDSIEEPQLYLNVKNYTKNWINMDGFRSLEIDNYTTDKKKILFLGDSFTYGMSAMPLYNSFSDLVLAEGNVVFNLGIPGTNIINYYANAKKYIPLTQPDFVFTFYFPVNDPIYFTWDSTDYHYLPGHIVQQAWVPSIVDNKYYENREEWNTAVNNCLDEQLSFSFLKSLVLYHLFINKFYSKSIAKCFPNLNQMDEELTHYYLKKIDQVCLENGSKHIIVIIPPLNMDMTEYELGTKNTIFKDMEVSFPKNFVKEDYNIAIGDPHFNNLGHHKMKDYICQIIELSDL